MATANYALLEVQALFFRRRHQPRKPPPAKIRPGSPAPAIGPGTAAAATVTVKVGEMFAAAAQDDDAPASQFGGLGELSGRGTPGHGRPGRAQVNGTLRGGRRFLPGSEKTANLNAPTRLVAGAGRDLPHAPGFHGAHDHHHSYQKI